MLYVFGKLVEEEEGALGVWTTYIVCALGGSLVSFFVIPDAVSLGASAAVFGLFIVSVLLKLSWNIRKLLEAAILGQFVYQQVVREIQNHVAGGVATAGGQVNHLAHLCGALAGAILVLLLRQLPEPEGQK
ncbi:unnamed protein product [Ostreobium quekettii]|uniref:Peptidase S54 rhomboid domain-containing protein n=1 Tax=Ostreobium quekettii TaxID=121088 RepID=A0A8S1JAR8_9CHLO|nr:unnamed protein product [Ostreobium quekettii]